MSILPELLRPFWAIEAHGASWQDEAQKRRKRRRLCENERRLIGNRLNPPTEGKRKPVSTKMLAIATGALVSVKIDWKKELSSRYCGQPLPSSPAAHAMAPCSTAT